MDKWTLISLVLSSVALVLALPFGIAGTLMAPKLQQWWALRNKERSELRLELLRRMVVPPTLQDIGQLVVYSTRFGLMVMLGLGGARYILCFYVSRCFGCNGDGH